jgi:membrane protein implicated in regulation of membrane protease activity
MIDLLRWYNLIFLLPAGVAVLVLLIAGLETGGDNDADGGDGGDAADDGDGGDGGDAADGGDTDGGAVGHLLGFLGVGRAPLTIVLAALLIGWGVGGIAANEALQPRLQAPARFIGLSLAIAAGSALVSAKLFAELAARFMPKDESYAVSQADLVGLTGTVIYPVSESTGRIHVRDRYRTLHVKPARVAPGAPPIAKSVEVIVASEDAQQRYVVVEPLEFTTRQS